MGEDFSLNAEPGTYRVTGAPVQIVMTSYLLLDWFDIAIRHELAAAAAQGSGNGTRERQEAMIAAAACGHALEGVRQELEKHVGRAAFEPARAAEPKRGRDATAAYVNAALSVGLDVNPAKWRDRLWHLFETLRRPAVHPRADEHPPVAHPDPARAVSVSRESATYWHGAARESVDLLCEVMARVLESHSPAAVELAGHIRPRVEQLLADRAVDR
jgi:hypothetical protein